MRKNLIVSDPIQPYTFPGWMMMKPGALLMGLAVYRNSAMPASEWYVSDPNKLEIIQRIGSFPVNVILEKSVRWRQSLRDSKKLVASVAVYIRTRDDMRMDLEKHRDHNMLVKFNYQMPIGIFLGHIIRVDGVSYVNIMTPEGYDIWI